jgi:hypothetical protein
MYSKTLLPIVAATVVVLATLGGATMAAETATDIPKNSYQDPLTASEQSGIAQEENVSPNDGRASLPPSQDEGVIPDAGDSADRSAATETLEQNDAEDVERGPKGANEDEAAAILDESKKDFKVTRKDLSGCLKDWDPQTQMSKEEWAESCRTTLEYFPDGQ